MAKLIVVPAREVRVGAIVLCGGEYHTVKGVWSLDHRGAVGISFEDGNRPDMTFRRDQTLVLFDWNSPE